MRVLKCSSPVGSPKFNCSSPKSHYQHVVDGIFRSILNKPNSEDTSSVHIKDVDTARNKFCNLVAGGICRLQIVSDFDRTMSKYRHNGSLTPTCHGIFEMDPELTEAAKSRLRYLRDKYYPIEVDPSLPDTEKIPHMLEWWSLSHDTIVGCGLRRDALAKTVRECGLVLRDGVRDFAEMLHKYQIPVLIFSAGLGNVIELLLEHFAIKTENVRVVSNFMEFNDEGLLTGFSDPIIHSFNKTAASIANGDYAQISRKRPCVLLLGDSTGDVHMADGATVDDPLGVCGTVLRVGFLNEAVEANLDKYKTIYDIVLVNDETFNVPLTMMRGVLQCHQTITNRDGPIT